MTHPEVLQKLRGIPSYSEELGLDLTQPEDRFKWFIASILFAKRISADIAKSTFKKFIEANLTSPKAIVDAGWDRLVQVLDAGGYVRYDFSTASNLLAICTKLLNQYGDIDTIHEHARDGDDLEHRLLEFKGVGPTAVNIFLRELRGIWEKANPSISQFSVEVAKRLALPDSHVPEVESQLVRIYLEYCKKQRCEACPVTEYCKHR